MREEEHEELEVEGKTGYWVLSAFVFFGERGKKKNFFPQNYISFQFFLRLKRLRV